MPAVFTLPDLPYAPEALEPHIDAETMRIHHGKHHAAYVTNLNAALAGQPAFDAPDEIEELLRNFNSVPEPIKNAVRNNGGGHANHTLFWQIMGPNGGGEPTGAIGDAIRSSFGNFGDFKTQLKQAGVTRFGSGWAWVVLDGSALAITSTANQDSPLMEGRTPVMGVDVWEHSYYLRYQNRRPDYLEAWFNTVNWDAVNQRFQQVQNG